MDVKSFIKIGLFSVGIPAVNIGSAFGCGWKCSMGHEHTNDELLCPDTDELRCKVPMCSADFHMRGEACPEAVMTFPSEGIMYAILPLDVPKEKITDLWLEYGCGNVERDGEYCSKIELEQNIEVQRLESQVQKLKEKVRKSSSGYLKKQEQLKKLNALGKKYGAKGNKMLSEENMKKKILLGEACVKQGILKKSSERKKELQLKKGKKDGE